MPFCSTLEDHGAISIPRQETILPRKIKHLAASAELLQSIPVLTGQWYGGFQPLGWHGVTQHTSATSARIVPARGFRIPMYLTGLLLYTGRPNLARESQPP
jgi:hypothetical protein